MLEKVIKALSSYGDKLQYEGFCHNKTVIQDYINWLKDRVIPQKQWKPSKEMLDALFRVTQFNPYSRAILTSLYEQLKAIKEGNNYGLRKEIQRSS